MTYLNIALFALELIFIISEIVIVCSFKSPRKVSEKSIKIIQSSLTQKPHKIIAKKLA
jgi:GTPase SAR1 family protein